MVRAAKKRKSAAAGQEALPVLIMVVDEDLRIHELNGAAREFLGPDHKGTLSVRSGEAFDCAHHKTGAAGCGSGRFCQICPIREAATEAWQEQRVVRRRTKAETGMGGQFREVHLLVTATPLPKSRVPRILMVIEDISELVEIQTPVPICAYCKRIREDDRYWQQLEVHVQEHLDVDLCHGLCPDCKKQLNQHLSGQQVLRVASS
jgi:hypothetical protein